MIRVLKGIYRGPWTLRRKLGWTLAAVSLAGTLVFATLAYQASRETTLDNIDDMLCTAAEGARSIVPAVVAERAEERPDSEYTATYRAAQAELERYAAATGLIYIYSITVRPDGTAYELVSNLSEQQRSSGADPMTAILQRPYTPSPGMVAIARTGLRQIDVARDEYGYLRSCLVPVPTTGGRVALFGADLEVSDVERRLLRELGVNLAIGLFVLVLTLFVVRAISNNLAKDVRAAVAETEAISRLAFMQGDSRLTSTTLEIDQLYGALFDMTHGLRAFGKYVPSSVLKRVLASGMAEIGGEARELSLLMTDVTDFTTISDQLDAARVMTVMSEYFGDVVAPILEMHGTLDKYVGDAIFAYWNAPTLQDDHAALCCAAALRSRAASRRLAERWKAEGMWPWHTRFGLHAGETIFGNVGAPDRMDFTVIGSSVNLASRIEGLNKFYGTEILASHRIAHLAREQFVFRYVDLVLPKGAVHEIEIYELLGDREGVYGTALSASYLDRWHGAVHLYKTRQWQAALSAFDALALEQAEDTVVALYLARCRAFVAAPPPLDSDGVHRFDVK